MNSTGELFIAALITAMLAFGFGMFYGAGIERETYPYHDCTEMSRESLHEIQGDTLVVTDTYVNLYCQTKKRL
jgi:hypothetical protein